MLRLRCHRCCRTHPRLYLHHGHLFCVGCLRRARRSPRALWERVRARMRAVWDEWRHQGMD